MKCEETYPVQCTQDAICDYAGELLCGDHARRRFAMFLHDAQRDYVQRIGDIKRDFQAAMDAGIQPQDQEIAPDDLGDL